MREERRDALTFAAIVSCCAIAIGYSLCTLLQGWLFPGPDPRMVLDVDRIAMLWRLLIALYVAAMAGIGAFAARRRYGVRAEAQLPRLAAATLVIAALQGVLRP